MASKKQKETEKSQETTENYYDLKTDAVKRLLNADKKTYTDTKKDPGKEYRSGFLDKIPSWLLALFVKFWFNGAVCFYIAWGLGLGLFDMILVLAVVLGIVTDVMVNNVFRFFATYKGQNDRWMMFPKKAYWTFLANIPYAMVVLICVIWLYEVINVVGNAINGTEGVVILGVEPVFFGLFYLAFDMCFIGMKNMMIRIINDAKQKSGL